MHNAQLVIDGLATGLVYVILACGMVLVLSINKILFMAYGVFYTIGAYVTWYAVNSFGFPYWAAVLVGMFGAAFLGILSYLLIFHYLQRRQGSFLATLMASMGLNLVLSQGGLLIYGSQQRGLPQVFPAEPLSFLGLHITWAKLALLLCSVVVTVLLFLVYERTRVGRAMRAVAFNPQAAGLQGVNTKKVYLITFGAATAMAGIAGGIYAPTYGMSPSMGFNVLWTVFLMTMLGGADSLMGALVGGLVIGQILAFGQFYLGGIVQIILFALIGIVLYFRPQGLLGRGVDIGM